MHSKAMPVKNGADMLASTHPVVFFMYHDLEMPGRALAQPHPPFIPSILLPPTFPDPSRSALRQEIVDAKLQLEQIVGLSVEQLSWPGGRFDRRVAEVAQNAGYLTVATSQIQANRSSTDRFALGRVAIMRDTSLADFWNICHARALWRLKMGVLFRDTAMKVLGNSTYDRVRGALLRMRPSRPV